MAAGTFKTLPLIWGRSKRDPSPIRALLRPNPALEVVVKLEEDHMNSEATLKLKRQAKKSRLKAG